MASEKADIETPLNLQELEPSPIEDTPRDSAGSSYFPSISSGGSSSGKPSHFLGFGDHGVSYYLLRAQRYSTYAFSAFSIMHITNTSLIPLITRSVPQSETYLLLTRPYYQNRPFEPLLIGIPLLVHVGSGLALRLLRRQQAGRRYGTGSSLTERRKLWPSVSVISATGFMSVWLVAGHALINRAVPLWTEGSSANVGLEYVSHGVSKHPLVASLGFTVLVSVAVGHMTWGWARWLSLTPSQVTPSKVKEGEHIALVRKRRWYMINGAALGVTMLWLAGGLGVVGMHGPAEGWLAGVYDGVYRNVPLIGKWY